MNHVNSIIGQERAKSQISGLFQTEICGGPIAAPIKPRLVIGPSGTGKSHLISQVLKDLAALGIPATRIEDSSALALQSSPATRRVCDALNASQFEPQALVLDEAQNIFKNGGTCANARDLKAFIFCHGETVKPSASGTIAGDQVTANFHNLILILATNEKFALESSESRRNGQNPIARRLSQVELGNYSQEEMEAIIPPFFSAAGYHIGETASGLVKRLHRGNMEALCEVADRIKESVPGKSTLNKAEVIAACKLTRFLPRGLTRNEGALLQALTFQDLSRPRAESISGIHGKPFDSTINHLTGQFWQGKHAPMITIVGASKYRVTDFGKRYLQDVLKDGFTFAS